jgi:hypothetical protein
VHAEATNTSTEHSTKSLKHLILTVPKWHYVFKFFFLFGFVEKERPKVKTLSFS